MFFSEENINTKDDYMIAQSTTICPLQICTEICSPFCRHYSSLDIIIPESLNNKVSAIVSKTVDISGSCKPAVQQSCEYEDFSVAQFIRFLKHIKLKKLLSKINDPRQNKKIKYSNDIILQWALSVYFFRQGSKNGLQTTLQKLKPQGAFQFCGSCNF